MITGGIDEVGWGALAGPIISVVAVFRPSDLALLPPGVKDSKKTTDIQRETMFLPLCQAAYDVGIGHAWPWEIDQYSPYPALQLSYRRALGDLLPGRQPELLYVDGKNRIEKWLGVQQVEAKADVKYKEVSAASIIAKVFRDCIMASYGRILGTDPYGWSKNKGYGTEDHLKAIKENGLLVDGTTKTQYLHRLAYCKRFKREIRNGGSQA
jgi:ribonuclease HII